MFLRALIFVLFVGVLIALYLITREYASLDALIDIETRIHSGLGQHPYFGFLIGFAIYIVVSLVPGTTGKALIIGWFYGFWIGLVIVNIGLTVAALMSFFISRYLLHHLIEARFGTRLNRMNEALSREGASYLFAARVLHAPFSLTNYLLGATRIGTRGFWWSTQLGILPGNLLFVYAGAQVPTLRQLSEQGVTSMLSPGLLFAFVAISVLPLLIRWLVRRIMARAATLASPPPERG